MMLLWRHKVTIFAVLAVGLTLWAHLHNSNIRNVSVGMSKEEILVKFGAPSRVDSPATAYGERYESRWVYRWYGPLAILAGHERWVYFDHDRVAVVYDAQSP